MLLAADVGGTKTDLAVYDFDAQPTEPIVFESFPSAAFSSLPELVSAFLNQVGKTVQHACFGVAGPVVQGEAQITNLPWKLNQEELKQQLKLASVQLINDLVATAYGVMHLTPNDCKTLNQGQPDKDGTLAVVAPGTGLGQAYLTWDGSHYCAHGSEGGHVDFAPRSQLEFDLLQYLQQRFGHGSVERVCSGLGIPNIFAFLEQRGDLSPRPQTARLLADAPDPNPIIAAQARADPACELCQETLSLFCRILGAVCGNFALSVLATGGVYLAGGIPPRIQNVIAQGDFWNAFIDKGRFSSMMQNLPVYLVLNPKVALLGAAWFGHQSRVQSE